jgi:peptidoglycan L-alanyl-D-glutamate endopeptidase CwlK
MRDKISEARVALLHPRVRAEVKYLIEKVEREMLGPRIAIRVVEAYRSIAHQDNLYALGRTKVNPVGKSKRKPMGNIVTNARGGKSFHNYGLAFDFAILYDIDGNGTWETLSWNTVRDFDKDKVADWKEIVKVFESHGWEWGGRWATIVDAPHLQKTFGHKWQTLLARYNEGQFIDKYVII